MRYWRGAADAKTSAQKQQRNVYRSSDSLAHQEVEILLVSYRQTVISCDLIKVLDIKSDSFLEYHLLSDLESQAAKSVLGPSPVEFDPSAISRPIVTLTPYYSTEETPHTGKATRERPVSEIKMCCASERCALYINVVVFCAHFPLSFSGNLLLLPGYLSLISHNTYNVRC